MTHANCNMTKMSFQEACHKNNIKEVKRQIARGVDVNAKSGSCNDFGLYSAAWSNYVELSEILLSHPDIDVNNQDVVGLSSLMIACAKGSVEVTKNLVEAPGIDVNCQDDLSGNTAAIWAMIQNHAGCVEILSKNPEVDWNMTEVREGFTAPMRGVENNSIKSIKILTKLPNIDWNWKNMYGDTALTLALKKKKSKMTNILLNIPELEVNIEDLKRHKVYNRSVRESRKIISSCGQRNKKKISPVVYAILNNKKNFAKILMSTKSAVKECREYVGDRMRMDGLTEKEINDSTKLFYSLKMNDPRNIVNLLVSGASTQDIVDLVIHWKSSLKYN